MADGSTRVTTIHLLRGTQTVPFPFKKKKTNSNTSPKFFPQTETAAAENVPNGGEAVVMRCKVLQWKRWAPVPASSDVDSLFSVLRNGESTIS